MIDADELRKLLQLLDPVTFGGESADKLLSAVDKGKQLSVRDNQVHVGGVHRTDIGPGHSGNGIPAPSPCPNVLPNWAANNGKTCDDIAKPTGGRCASAAPDSQWITDKLCQQSCFDVGHGYPGDDCSAGWPSLPADS